jgi:putative addiction module killer protein
MLPSNRFEVLLYRSYRGCSPFQEWFEELDVLASRKVTTALIGFESGNFSDSRNLKGGIWERRIHSGPGYRVYYAIDLQHLVIVLTGGTKKTQSMDIKKARVMWYEYKTRTS